MYVDCHVHFRDFTEQRHKETIKHGLEVARDSGVSAVFDMPNCNPPVVDEETVKLRLNLARNSGVKDVSYGTYIGATADPEQLKRAVDLHRKLFPRVVGIKMYAGESVGNLAIIEPRDQLIVYGTLAAAGYDGVLAVHSEKETKMERCLWKPSMPISHCLARPPESEVESVKDQMVLAEYSKFEGKLHIAHISCPEAVEVVADAKTYHDLDVSCGVCPHHIIFDWAQMTKNDGVLWKMNPPLRPTGNHNQMMEYLREGKINWIETDHAPHTLDEKKSTEIGKFMSGLPGLPWWPMFAEHLRNNNFSDDLIEKVTCTNVLQRFGMCPDIHKRNIKDRRGDYAFNPYDEFETKNGLESVFQ